MHDGDILIIKGDEVVSLLTGRELEIIATVRSAYEAHGSGDSSLPHSTFLTFPDNSRNRIIALPAYLGGGFNVAGMKWVASFPANLDKGLDRASAVVILNCSQTGRPQAIIEGSVINAKRTAASAALACDLLHRDSDEQAIGLIGCGLINFEIARFLRAVRPQTKAMMLYDLDRERARQFKAKLQRAFDAIDVEVVEDLSSLFKSTTLLSFATTASTPYVASGASFLPGTTILHVSLRDLAPEVILSCDNIADDADHVCRAQTSLHLTEQLVGNRDFIRCDLAHILSGSARPRVDAERAVIFSPFGLGVLDVAVGRLLFDLAAEERKGMVVSSFLPDSWAGR